MVFNLLNLATTLSLSCHYNPQQCANETGASFPPPVIQYGHQNQTLMLGDSAILPCQSSGRVAPNITWHRDGAPLPLAVGDASAADEDAPPQRYKQLATGTLQIVDLRKSDTGVYTCRARNEDGEALWTASLSVEEHTNRDTMFTRMPEAAAFPTAPGRPAVLSATEDSVELEWGAPERQGASPLVGYILQFWSPEAEESWQNVLDVIPATRFRVRHLQPAHSYAFVVRAENAKGIGPPSAISELVATKAPSVQGERERLRASSSLETARQRLASEQLIKLQEVRAVNATAVLLTWRRQRREPLVHGYYIKWRGPPLSAEHSWVNVTDAEAQSVVIDGLRPFSSYEFFVIPYHHTVQGMPSNSLETSTLEAAPSQPPQDVRLRMLNATSLRVSWRPPPADALNGLLKGYLLNIRSNHSEERNITTNERATSVTLYRLIPDASYAVRLSARTGAGWGVFYEAGAPIVMNAHTLHAHMRQAAEARHVDAWYRQPWSVLAIGVVLWLTLILTVVLLWWRCCYRRRRKKKDEGGGGARERDFIKIRDGSVANSVAQHFWAAHDAAGTGDTFAGADCCAQYSDYGGSSAGAPAAYPHHHGSSGTLPHHHHSHAHLHHSCGAFHPPPPPVAVCCGHATIQQQQQQRQCSESPQHYHYAQLPEPCCGAAMSTFYDPQQQQQRCSARQLNEYYDDPSPYATTTLVMSSAAGAVANGHGTLRSGRRGGPALPVNPIPKEPPHFLAAAAVAAGTVPAEQHSAGHCCASSSSCGALVEGDPHQHGATRRSTAARHSARQMDPQTQAHGCYFAHAPPPQQHRHSSRNHHTHGHRPNKYPHAAPFATAARVKHNRSSSVNAAEQCAGGRKATAALGVLSTRVSVRRSSPPPQVMLLEESPQNTDVSYLQSSDGTNGSSKAARALGGPTASLLELIPPPPCETPPSDECAQDNDYDPVAEGFVGSHQQQPRRNSRNFEPTRHSRTRISLIEGGRQELDPLMRSYDMEADGELSEEEEEGCNGVQGYCGYSPAPAGGSRPTRQPLMGVSASAISQQPHDAPKGGAPDANGNSGGRRDSSSSKLNTQAHLPSGAAKHDFV